MNLQAMFGIPKIWTNIRCSACTFEIHTFKKQHTPYRHYLSKGYCVIYQVPLRLQRLSIFVEKHLFVFVHSGVDTITP